VTAAAVLLTLGTITAILYPAIAKKGVRPELQGAWEGALQDKGRTLRMVFKVTKRTDGSYAATCDSIDQGAADIPVSHIAYSNTTVLIAIKSLKGNFNGEMNPNGSQITGIWEQVGMTFPLTLKRTEKPALVGQALPISAYTPRPGSDLQGYWV